jgi:hypothetical protein
MLMHHAATSFIKQAVVPHLDSQSLHCNQRLCHYNCTSARQVMGQVLVNLYMSLDQRLACTVSPDKRLHLRFKFISIIQQ